MRDFESANRSTVHAATAMAATSHPRATLAAVETMRAGGNAIDAAICAASVLAVIEPQMTGIGGDCFVLYAPAGGAVVAYNGSGAAPMAAEAAWYRDHGIAAIEPESVHAVTVPGAVEAWHRLVSDHGQMAFGDLLQPAIALAGAGYPVPPRVAYDWANFEAKLARTDAARRLYLRDGRALRTGDIHRQPALAATLGAIARDGPAAFYGGTVAEAMVETLAGQGGLHTLDDFARHRGEYAEPVATPYRGYDVLECPPNGQGLIALMILNICAGFDFAGMDPLDPKRLHLMAEAGRLAYRDRDAYIGDPRHSPVPVDALLSPAYADALRGEIREDRAMAALPAPTLPALSNTTYLCVVDGDGNAVSFINSLFNVFGTGLACEKTGILFQNRGFSFTLEDGHPNVIAPGKRPMHTIVPAMLVKDGRAVMPFGVMGGHFQPFGHAFVLGNILDCGLDIQAAVEVPRIFPFGGVVAAERGIPEATVRALAALGHDVRPAGRPLGGGQAIWIDRDRGVLTAGSDPRKDGCALGY